MAPQICCLILACLLTCGCGRQGGTAAPDSGPLFSAELATLSGEPANFSAYKGRPMIVNFWATWCPPCIEEIPELSRVQSRELVVVGISVGEEASTVRDFVAKQPIDYPVWLSGDAGTPLMKALGNNRNALPYSLAIDRQGRVVASKLGLARRADIEMLARAASGN